MSWIFQTKIVSRGVGFNPFYRRTKVCGEQPFTYNCSRVYCSSLLGDVVGLDSILSANWWWRHEFQDIATQQPRDDLHLYDSLGGSHALNSSTPGFGPGIHEPLLADGRTKSGHERIKTAMHPRRR